MNRKEIINTYTQNPEISVLIIGAGVNGIGTFRDLALQGVDVLLVDKGDFCSGASAASSHMVHGGIRYLENGEFRLVREAVQERNRLIENAPHYVKPLPTVIPMFKWFSGLFNAAFKFLGLLEKPSERGAVVIKVGMMFYDAFTRKQGTVPKHTFKGRRSSLEEFPQINPKVLFIGRYYDGAMHTPERICVELLLDGEAANPQSRALSYMAVEGLSKEGSSVDGISLVDQITGESFKIRPKVVVNAAGPWIDFANARLGFKTRFIGGTKGSHLIINNPELRAAIGENEFFFENKDGRIVLIYPLKEMVMIGTSDLPIDDPEEARCTEDEVDYFIEMVKIVFPAIPVKREQIVFNFSGVRPLPPGDVDHPGQISRDHSIKHTPAGDGLPFPVYSLVGGKWTSFRAFSEEVTDIVLEALKRPRKINTREMAIGGGRGYPNSPIAQAAWAQALSEKTGQPVERINELFERYGTRAEEVATYIAEDQDAPLGFLPGYSRREVEYIAREEKVVHIDDFLLRRSMLAKLGKLSHARIDELSKIIGKTLGWSAFQADEELKRVYAILRAEHGVEL